MSHVDALSRDPTKEASETMDDLAENRLEVLETIDDSAHIRSMQYSDPEIRHLINEFINGKCNRHSEYVRV